MAKIQMKTPLVEMDGDEMTRIIWKMIKEQLLFPYIDLKTEYYDLGLENRDRTDDRVSVEEYKLKEMWKSPNGTIRAILDGTVFRAPILVRGIEPFVSTWKKPITIARHAYGDVYKASETVAPKGARAEIVVTDENGTETRTLIHDFASGAGIVQGMHNIDGSIESYARSCFN